MGQKGCRYIISTKVVWSKKFVYPLQKMQVNSTEMFYFPKEQDAFFNLMLLLYKFHWCKE